MTDGKVYANKNINKGALKIFPFGNVQRVKEVKDDDETEKASSQGECEALAWGGCLSNHVAQGECGETKWCHFFWVGATKDEGLVNSQPAGACHGDLQIEH